MIPYIGPEIIEVLLRPVITSSCPSEISSRPPHSNISDESDSVPSRSVVKQTSFFDKLFAIVRRLKTTTKAVVLALYVFSR
jgi:hypothetical protein